MRHYDPVKNLGGLADLIKFIEADGKVMVEVGSYMGESASVFAKHVKSITAIDPWVEGYDDNDGASSTNMSKVEEYFDKTMSNFSNMKKIKMKSLEACKQFDDESLDFVYIDAEHTYEALFNDLKAWTPKVKKDGWICGHDWQRMDLRKAIVDVLGDPDRKFSDNSWCFKKSRLNKDFNE